MAPTKVKGKAVIGVRKSARGVRKNIVAKRRTEAEDTVEQADEENEEVVSKKAMKRTTVVDEPVVNKGKRGSTKATFGKFAQRVQKGILAKRPAAAEEEDEEAGDENEKPAAKKKAAKAAVAKKPAAAAKVTEEDEEAEDDDDEEEDEEEDDDEDEEEEEEEEEDKVTVSKKTIKRPAAAPAPDDEPVAKKNKKESTRAAEEKLVSERTKELKAMPVADLKDLVKSKGLAVGIKSDMLQSVLASEAKDREETRARETKAKEIAAEIKNGFASKGIPELKELCEEEGLKKGGGKDELVARLVQNAKEKGQIERVLEAQAREVRREQLLAMDRDKLCKLCSKAGVDYLVKEVMVERLLTAEMMSNA